MAQESKLTEADIAGRIFAGFLDCTMAAALDLMLLAGFIPPDSTAWLAAVFVAGFGTIIFPYGGWRDVKAFQRLQDEKGGE